jgi:hypothetical protein
MPETKEFQTTAMKASFPKPSAMRPRSHLFLLLAFLLSNLSLCSSSEDPLINDTISSGRLEGPLSITSIDQSQPAPHRQLIAKEGDVSLLVVRVSGRDRSPSLDNAFLYNSIFVKDASLRRQFYECSAGKLNVVPTGKGVLEVSVNMNILGANVADVVGHADIEGLKQLPGITNFRGYADLTMYVVPRGTKWNGNSGWTAYAIINGKASVMNDDSVKFPGVQMHELGHNFGLNHADGIDEPFGDLTTHMSRFIIDENFPHKCFNAQNHWLLGWYSDRSITVDPYVPVKINILGFVDYKKTIQGSEFVVAKVGENLYLQFNRAKLHNRQTEEAQDKLVIILDRGKDGTTMVAELDKGTSLYTVSDFESSGKQLNVEVCRVFIGDTDDNVDWMEVSIGYGASLCGGEPTPRPSPRPSAVPSPRPSPRPSPQPSLTKVFNPIPQLGPQPTLRPTSKPTPRPSPQPSPRPSHKPSPQPTPRPSVGSAASIQQFGAFEAFDASTSEPTTAIFGQVAGRFKDRINGERPSGVINPDRPTRVIIRRNDTREEFDFDQESGAAAGLGNSLVVYTMVAMASVVAAMLC